MENFADNYMNYPDTSIPLTVEETPTKRIFFHQWIAFQISKNPHLAIFARQTLMATHPRAIANVQFGQVGELFITYTQGEEPTRYNTVLTRDLNIADVSWSQKYNCYFDYLKGCPFVVDADLIILLYLASLEGDMEESVIGEWMRSATKGRYVGFNPVHLTR
jgi:hypothetical protein